MGSPLYKNAEALFKRQARQRFQKTEFGQLVGAMSSARKGAMTQSKVRNIRRRLGRLKNMGIGDVLQKTETGRMATQIARYAKGSMGGRSGQAVLDYVFESLGPLGGLLRGLIRPGGKALTGSVQNELDAAQQLLQAFGYNVARPGQRAKPKTGRKDRAQDFLESLGFTVTPPEEVKPDQPKYEPPRQGPLGKPKPPKQVPDGKIEIRIGGRKRVYDETDAVLTGEMLRVESSNVWAIGYVFNHANPMKGDLRVQFGNKHKGSNQLSAGPIYEYHGIHPDVFAAFQAAQSKGEFVWDRLRIRGTVSGHTVPYDLIAISGGYVPRNAARFGQNEYFVKRTVSVGGRQYESELDDQRVGRARPQQPKFGIPSDGRPSNGAPNRGR